MKKTIFLFTVMAFCISCTKNTNKEIKILKLPETEEEILKTSTFADTVIYVPLETTQESLIDNIESLWMNDSIILILHRFGLLKFDINGKFIKQIGNWGRGPGEYEGTFNFNVVDDTIYLSPASRRGFLRYTLEGTFCDEVQLNYHPILFDATIDQKLAVYERHEGKVFVYNKNIYAPPDTITVEYGVSGLRHTRLLLVDEKMLDHFQRTTSTLFFNSYLNDTIWNIAGNKKEPAFILNSKDKLLPWDKHLEYYNVPMENTLEWLESVKSYYFFNLVPVANNIFIFQNAWWSDDYTEDNYYFYQSVYFGNIQTGEFRKYDDIYDDITANLKLTWFYHIYSKDYLVGEVFPYDLQNDPEVSSRAWLNQRKNIMETDNPILVLVKVKKN